MPDVHATGGPAPQAALLQMMEGYWVSQAIYVAAKLGLADLLQAGPRPVEDLATTTQTHAPAPYRVLRALASVGIFAEGAAGSFALTPTAALLQTERPDSLRALAILYGEEQYRAWGDLRQSVATGEPAFERVFGLRYFPYLAQHPAANETFHRALSGMAAQLAGAVLAAYDFSACGTVIDIGGGHGRLLATILRAHPQLRGILFDQPHVVAGATAELQQAGVSARCATIGGDFFAAVPSGGDAYILAEILHDWDDERSRTILRNCRRACGPASRLLLIEVLIAPGNEPDLAKFLDLHMLVLLGGRERTKAQYRTLLAEAGFALTAVVPTQAGSSVIEARPV